MENSPQVAIKRACTIVEGQAFLARHLGVTPAAVNQWVKGLRPIPSKYCPKIEGITAGRVRCEDLCPEVDWTFLRVGQSAGTPHRSPDPTLATGHCGRQPPSTNNILDTVPEHAVIVVAGAAPRVPGASGG